MRFPLLAVTVVLLLSSCGKADNAKTARTVPARQVRVSLVERRPMERVLEVVGTLAPHDEATVAAQVAGQIEKGYVDVGDRVTAGQKLALINTSAYEVLLRQAAANVAKANARAANAELTLKRVQQLHDQKVASTSDLDQADTDAGQARADAQAAAAAHAIALLNLERSRVKAPFDGAVAERVASVGDYVAVGTPIVRVVKTDPLRLRLDVPERESPAVRLGQAVRVTVEGDPRVHAGRLARIAPAIRGTGRTLQVEADVPNAGGVRAGLFAKGQIVIDDDAQALSIPAKALVTFAGLEKVVVVKDGKAVEKTVTTGRRGTGWIEIVSGVGAGERVVLEPAGLRTGQPVTVAQQALRITAGAGGSTY